MKTRALIPLTRMSICVVVAGLITACESSTAPTELGLDHRPNTAMLSNQRTAFDTVVFNPCTGEDVALSGTAHVLFSVTQPPTGGLHLNFHLNEHMRGVGVTTGIRYQSNNTNNFTLNTTGLPFEQTSVAGLRLLSQGARSNLQLFALQHITVDANGIARVFKTDFRVRCT